MSTSPLVPAAAGQIDHEPLAPLVAVLQDEGITLCAKRARELASKGLPHFRIGTRLYVKRSEVRAWIETQRRGPAPQRIGIDAAAADRILEKVGLGRDGGAVEVRS